VEVFYTRRSLCGTARDRILTNHSELHPYMTIGTVQFCRFITLMHDDDDDFLRLGVIFQITLHILTKKWLKSALSLCMKQAQHDSELQMCVWLKQ